MVFCLMSLQLLTGREVLRTHIFWRIMLKRVLWGIFEEMRRNTETYESALEAETGVPIEDLDLNMNVGERQIPERLRFMRIIYIVDRKSLWRR